ncbi:hypothetical protein [Streptomyces syringium]|uniref:hypothetical protein n=1 Tax=Streptomyces syringium TaxID=76729 RepID=UPI0037D71F1F
MTSRVDEVLLWSLTPGVLTVLVRRGADFAAAEDAVQEALVEAVRGRPADPSPSSRLRSSTTPGARPGPRPTAAWCRSPSRTAAGGTHK